jgi:hypothetical protein
MAALITLQPHDERGEQILDTLEQQTGESTERLEDGGRKYPADAVSAGVDAFDAMLDSIDPSWRDHLSRTVAD